MELHLVRDEAEQILAEVAAEKGVTLTIPIGTMIELPRAALTAHRIADAADFFSFGTNDLTQTTWGFSRDDVESIGVRRLPGQGRLHRVPVRDHRRRRRRAAGARSPPRRVARPSPVSSSGSAVSTAVTPNPSTSSTRPGWTTCPAPRSGYRSPASKPAGPPSADGVRLRPIGFRWASGLIRAAVVTMRQRPRSPAFICCEPRGAGVTVDR